MMLNQTQRQALKSFIQADAELSLLAPGIDSAYVAADKLYGEATPAFYVWSTGVNLNDIFDAITWANYTPSDLPDNTIDWSNRSLACQGKQFNLQILLSTRSTLNASRQNIRSGLQDALSQLPSGPSGALRNAGWSNVQTILSRKANILEKLFSAGTGTQASPATMAIEGRLQYQEVMELMGW